MSGRRTRANRRRLALMLTAKPAMLAVGSAAQQQVVLAAANISVGCNANQATREGDLKTAITTANGNTGSTTVSLAANCVYTLTTPSSGGSGLPSINGNVVVDGNGATITRDNGGSAPEFRIARVVPSGVLTLNHLTISNGVATNDTGGGGIWNNGGTLHVNNSTITTNTAKGTGTGSISAKGGGILSGGTTTVTNSQVSHNHVIVNGTEGTSSAVAAGGGIAAKGGTLTVTNTTMSTNFAVVNATLASESIATGGGIAAKGGTDQGNGNVTVNVVSSTLEGNLASVVGTPTGTNQLAEGGGIGASNVAAREMQPSVTVHVTNTTITGNHAVTSNNSASGGGLSQDSGFQGDTLTVVNSTIAQNTANGGAGVASSFFVGQTQSSGTVTLTNTLLSTNTLPSSTTSNNCAGTVVDGGHNLSFPATDTSCSTGTGNTGNHFATGDPKLGGLASNGGPTQTMALGDTSAAIDTADPAVCKTIGSVDQRALPRFEVTGDGTCDIGAFEVQPVAAVPPTPPPPGLPAAGVATTPVSGAGGTPWALLPPGALAASALVGVALRRRPAEDQAED